MAMVGEDPQYLRLPCKVADVYQLTSRLGKGSYGQVYRATHTGNAQTYAVKVAPRDRDANLKHEARLLEKLQRFSGFTTVHGFVKDELYDILVIELCGMSMQTILNVSNSLFGIRETINLGIEVVCRLESLHSIGYIHRDVTPANLLSATTCACTRVYLVDFGFATRFQESKTKTHKQFEEGKRFVGTPRFASVNAHLGIRQSRRDDLQALGYVLVYLAKGTLPWSHLMGTAKEVRAKILQMKQSISVETLCHGLPACFSAYMRYCQSLEFEETPDYDHLRRLLSEGLAEQEDEAFVVPTTAVGPVALGRFSL
eukprot:TRINITY_DN8842_c0_g1_i1.p1 TRINITY_DN8842_c0_g1~~TRINITY_DN8842_c0_g1_i1.p1  ORF type:complete len:313 (+),score=23.50 TRINITY_DN8842_c0_g1_i1:139-1077(+)